MTRDERKRQRADFLRALAAEIASHVDNASSFVFDEPSGEQASNEIVDLRIGILRSVCSDLFRKARR